MSQDLAFAGGAVVELISFEIGGQEFCIDIRSVREIRGWAPATPMPHSPEYIVGVINLRGMVMPVIDLRSRLGLGQTEPTERHVIVVIQADGRTAGLLVDGVRESFHVETSSLQAPPDLGDGFSHRFVDAILPFDGRLMSRLVVNTLVPMSNSEMAA
ncbi:MAG: chemotaxis protein CheW [Pseudomonadota bacterium]